MAIKPDWTQGRLSLFAGSNQFTTTGSALRTVGIQAGDALLTQSGTVLVIAEITDENSGSLYEPCPPMAAGFDQPLRVRFQADGSRLPAATRELMALLGSGNAYAFQQLLGDIGKIPYFTGPGVMGLLDLASLGGGGGNGGWDALVPTLAGRDAFNGEAAGFRVLVADNGSQQAVIYEKTGAAAADWSVPVPFTGPKGSDGQPNHLSVGTVTEGPVAHVSITGTPPNQFVNFVLRRGEKGNTGDVTPEALAAKEAAETARNLSEKWASNPVDEEVEAGKFSALHHAAKAKTENDGAAASAAIVRDNKPNIDLIAANMAKVNTVADVAPQVVVISVIAEDVQTVANIAPAVPKVASIDAEVVAVSQNAVNIIAVADNETNITVVAGIASKVSAVAAVASDVGIVAGIATHVAAVSAIDSAVAAVAGIKTDISTVAANASNINTVAANKTNIDTVAENAAAVSAVSVELATVKSAADNLAAIIAAPDKAQEASEARDHAHDWANAPEDQLIDDGEHQGFSAFHHSKKAEAIAGGGVTSVGLTLPDSLVVDIPSITTSGIFSITHADGYQGYTTTEAGRLAGMQDNADVTTSARVGASLAGPTPSTDLVDGDKIGGIGSGGATLKTWSWATIKASIKALTDTLYAPAGKVAEIDANTNARHIHDNKLVLDQVTAPYTTAEKAHLATIASNADVTTSARVGASLAGPTPSADLVDGDKIGGIGSGGATLKTWSWATIKAGIRALTDTLYAPVGKVAEIDANSVARHAHSNKLTLDQITAAYTTAEKAHLATIAANADVTTTARVGAALAGPTPSTDLVDGDKIGGIGSGGATLKTWSWATIKAGIKVLTDTLYASKGQGEKADTAVQPSGMATALTAKQDNLGFSPVNKAGDAGIGGYTSIIINDGNFAGGIYKPTIVGSNFRLISTSGAFTLQAPDGDVYTMIVKIGIGAGAGSITMTGFTKVIGDNFTVTAGHHFLVYITKIYDVTVANIVGLQ